MREPRYFRWHEFDSKNAQGTARITGSGAAHMDRDFVERLDALRAACGFVFIVTSGYRIPKYNAKISSTGLTGPHTKGRAADIAVAGGQAYEVLRLAPEFGMTGIGVAQKGAHGRRFIHLDDLTPGEDDPRPWVWSY